MIRLAPDVRKVLDQYDVLFSVGGDLFTLSLPSDIDPMPPAIKLIHLDIDPWELGKNYPPAVAILGDPKAHAAGHHRRRTRTHDQRRPRRRARAVRGCHRRRSPPSATRSRRKPARSRKRRRCSRWRCCMRSERCCRRTRSSSRRRSRPRRASASSSAAMTRRAISACAAAASAGGCLRRSASSSRSPDRPVVGLIGDGSAMYTCQGLWTAARYRIDAVFVILNNSSYRILKQRLHAMRGLAEQADSYVGMELVDPKIDFVGAGAFARRYGGARQDRARDHRSRSPRRFKNGGPTASSTSSSIARSSRCDGDPALNFGRE